MAKDTPFSVYSTAPLDALSYYINMFLGEPITERQRNAVDLLSGSDKEKVRAEAKRQLETVDVPVRPDPQPVPHSGSGFLRNLPLPTRRPARGNTPPPAERRPSGPSTVNTQSTSLGRRIAESLMEAIGDTRTMEQASEDARKTKKMEEEREMNVAGRKKGGMVKKKKAPVKKAYGGMVKKKQGGSARKVNTKAGFTRRGCSKG